MPKVLRIKQTLVLPPTDKTISAAARLIRRGGLVAFPTETVYGLGGGGYGETGGYPYFCSERAASGQSANRSCG